MFNPATYRFSAHSSQRFTLKAGQQIDLCLRQLSLITTRFFLSYRPQIWYIFSFDSPTRVPNFSLIEVCSPELQQLLCLCEKKKKKKKKQKLKLCSLVSRKQLARYALFLECSLPLQVGTSTANLVFFSIKDDGSMNV